MLFGRHRTLEAEASLVARAADRKEFPRLEDLNATALLSITSERGVDFATALLFDRFRHASRHVEFIQRIDALRQCSLPNLRNCGVKIAIVPGALYRERPDFGGDGLLVREVAEQAGLETDLLPLNSRGAVTANSAAIREWLARHASERLMLVSLSKGGADLKMALAKPDAVGLLRNVVAWVNVCGPLDGSQLANWIVDSRVRRWICRFQYRLQRRDFRFVEELRRGNGTLLQAPLHLPASMELIHLVGFPLNRHFTTSFSRFCHRILSAFGPNDGTTLLADAIAWPGRVYPVWTADHYFRPPSMARELITAVFGYLAPNLNTKVVSPAPPTCTQVQREFV